MEIIEYLSVNCQNEIKNKYDNLNTLEEIRLRTKKPIILKFSEQENILSYKVSTQDILETLEKITESSRYSYEKQISEGFVTLPGGNRVGIVGNAVCENNKIINISYISGLNFRIARQIYGSSRFIENKVLENNTMRSTLIVGCPGSGKTTILKDLIRKISNGTNNFNGKTIGVVDERNEIASMYRGMEQNDLGIRTDVISNVPKEIGIRMLIRSMSPNVIAVDEIGGKKDTEILEYASLSGVKILATVHGNSFEDIKQNVEIKQLLEKNIIERILVLDKKKKGLLAESYFLNINRYERDVI